MQITMAALPVKLREKVKPRQLLGVKLPISLMISSILFLHFISRIYCRCFHSVICSVDR